MNAATRRATRPRKDLPGKLLWVSEHDRLGYGKTSGGRKHAYGARSRSAGSADLIVADDLVIAGYFDPKNTVVADEVILALDALTGGKPLWQADVGRFRQDLLAILKRTEGKPAADRAAETGRSWPYTTKSPPQVVAGSVLRLEDGRLRGSAVALFRPDLQVTVYSGAQRHGDGTQEEVSQGAPPKEQGQNMANSTEEKEQSA